MPPPGSSPSPSRSAERDETRARRRQELLLALRDGLAELTRGGEVTYTELSVAAMAEHAGVSRPTFYAYFSDKNAVLRALAGDVAEALAEATFGRLSDPFATRDELDPFVTGVMAAYAPHHRVIAATVEVAAYDTTMRAWYAGIVEEAAQQLASHIRRGQSEGWVRAGLPPLETARWLAWTTERGIRRAYDDKRTPAARMVTTLTDLFWFTLYAGVG